jgi:hypothetical protein
MTYSPVWSPDSSMFLALNAGGIVVASELAGVPDFPASPANAIHAGVGRGGETVSGDAARRLISSDGQMAAARDADCAEWSGSCAGVAGRGSIVDGGSCIFHNYVIT